MLLCEGCNRSLDISVLVEVLMNAKADMKIVFYRKDKQHWGLLRPLVSAMSSKCSSIRELNAWQRQLYE